MRWMSTQIHCNRCVLCLIQCVAYFQAYFQPHFCSVLVLVWYRKNDGKFHGHIVPRFARSYSFHVSEGAAIIWWVSWSISHHHQACLYLNIVKYQSEIATKNVICTNHCQFKCLIDGRVPPIFPWVFNVCERKRMRGSDTEILGKMFMLPIEHIDAGSFAITLSENCACREKNNSRRSENGLCTELNRRRK